MQVIGTNPAGEKGAGSTLHRQTEHNIHLYSVQPKAAIDKHIEELSKEWSTERVIEAGASVLAIVGILLGVFVNPWCLILPAIVSAIFLAHALLQFNLLAVNGTRSGLEITAETFAMKLLKSESDSANTDKAALAERVTAATRAFCCPD